MIMSLINKVSRLADYLNAVMFLIMTAGVVVAVFFRYVFRSPVPAGMEIAYFAMLWGVFLQTGNALFEDRHVSMSFVKDQLSSKSNDMLSIILLAIILITVIFLTWYSASLTWESFKFDWRTSGSVPMPQFLLYGIMFLGSFYLVIISVFKILEHGRKLIVRNNGV